MGVGHIKIEFENKEDKFHNFFFEKVEDLYKKYKDNFYPLTRVPKKSEEFCSLTRFYMMFFYIVDEKNEQVLMSNFFLPVGNNPYKFNVIFPMGFYLKEKNLYVTAGEGDYYSVEMKFDYNDVIKSCIHDVRKAKPDDFEYQLIEIQ